MRCLSGVSLPCRPLVPLEYRVGALTCWFCCGAWLSLGVSRGAFDVGLHDMIARFVLEVAAVLVRREVSKDVELLVLRHENTKSSECGTNLPTGCG
jgi:hypothetical protein